MTPTVFNFGLGCDSSSAIWALDQGLLDVDPSSVIVLTAQTGAEWSNTAYAVEKYVYPILRKRRIRTVQIARSKLSSSGPIVVLDDTRSPTKCFIRSTQEQEYYSLATEMTESGTIPQYFGTRKCSIHAKGDILDSWVLTEFGDRPVQVATFYNSDEEARRERELKVYASGRKRHITRINIHPLIDLDWNREKTERVATHEVARGEMVFPRSACCFCPFSGCKATDPMNIAGSELEILQKCRQMPEEAGWALFIEYVAMCLNPRQQLYPHMSMHTLLNIDENYMALADFQARLEFTGWTLYKVDRAYVGVTNRRVTRLGEGSKADMELLLELEASDLGAEVVEDYRGIKRAWIEAREIDCAPPSTPLHPNCHSFLVVAPDCVQDKWTNQFMRKWEAEHAAL